MSTAVTLTREELMQRILAKRETLREMGVAHMALFGSRARGDAREDSDVDLMIDVDRPRFSILDLIGIEHAIGDDLGLPVQITLNRGLSERFRERISDDLITLF